MGKDSSMQHILVHDNLVVFWIFIQFQLRQSDHVQYRNLQATISVKKCWDIPLFLAYLALKSPLLTKIYPPSPPNNVEFARWEPAFIPVQHWIRGGGICVWKSFLNSKKWNWVHCHYILENVSTTSVAHCPRWSYCYVAFFCRGRGAIMSSWYLY